MQLSELLTATREKLAERYTTDDPTASTSFWQDAELTRYLNFAYQELVSQAELMFCESFIKSNPELKGLYGQPDDTLRITAVFYEGRDEELEMATLERLKLWDPKWRSLTVATGETPIKYLIQGQLFRLIPKDIAGGKEITIWAIQAPPLLVKSDDAPQISFAYHEAIVIGAARRALESDRTNPDNRPFLTRLDGEYAAIIALAAIQQKGKTPVKQMRDVRDYYSTASGWRA